MTETSHHTDTCECQAGIEYQRKWHVTAKHRSYDLSRMLHDVPTVSYGPLCR